MTGDRRVVLTALMFVLAVAAVVAAAVTHKAYPLFIAWVPLIAVPWILARPDPGYVSLTPDDGVATEQPGATSSS